MQPAELLCCMAVCVYAVNAAAGNGAATDLAGFLPGIQYEYSYSSSADVYEDISLTVTAKVRSKIKVSDKKVEYAEHKVSTHQEIIVAGYTDCAKF